METFWLFLGFFMFPFVIFLNKYHIKIRSSILWIRKRLYFCNTWKKNSNISESLFHLLFLMCLWKSQLATFLAIWDAHQGQMTSQKGQKETNFSLHETKELMQIIPEHPQLMFGVGYVKKNPVKEQVPHAGVFQLCGCLEDFRAS